MTSEQQQRYHERDNFLAAFQVIDQYHQNSNSSFFLQHYRQLFVDLTRRLHVNEAILDFNYRRLLHCFDLMIQERIAYGFQKEPLTATDILPFHEYPIALEFYLQIDRKFSKQIFKYNISFFCLEYIFFMKTCSFRDAIVQMSTSHHGVFCLQQPYTLYGMTACEKPFCHFCFPPSDVPNRTRLHQPVVEFSSAGEHRFVSGYRSILNGAVVSETI